MGEFYTVINIMYVFVYVCMCVCVYVRMYVRMYVCIYISVMYIHVDLCVKCCKGQFSLDD